MIEIVKPGIRYGFIAQSRAFMGLSAILVLGSILLLSTRGLNLGIDFKGGNKVIVAFQEGTDVDAKQLKTSISELLRAKTGSDDAGQIEVQQFDVGDTDAEGKKVTKYQIYMELTSLLTDESGAVLKEQLEAALGGTASRVAETDKYIVRLENPASVNDTKATIMAVLTGLDYSHATIVSEEERALDMEFYENYNLEVNENYGGKDDKVPENYYAERLAHHEVQKAAQLAERNDRQYTISLQQIQADVEAHLRTTFGADKVEVESSTSVSPSVGADLFNKGMLAMLYAIIGILIYIGLRFDFRYSPGAVCALIHDTLITLGIFSIFGIKFTLPIISALLTIIGYSLNDTIVVYDRIRENLTKFKGMDLSKLINQSINETLSRTLLTSITTLFVVLALLIFGGGLIADFALALTIGILVGTYSSVFIASPIVIQVDKYLESRKARARKIQHANA
jgi:preprotein translocase SecF subunit